MYKQGSFVFVLGCELENVKVKEEGKLVLGSLGR